MPAVEELTMDNPLMTPERTYSIVTMAATVCAAVLVLTACEPEAAGPRVAEQVATPTQPTARAAAVPVDGAAIVAVADRHPAPRADMGRITRIEAVSTPARTHGTGALIGGVVGAAVGHEVGDGKVLGTGLGAVGGAVLGSEIERRHKGATTSYRIHVRLDNGATRTFEAASNAGLHVGAPDASRARRFE
jgi:uncharacterized protein YcfJ